MEVLAGAVYALVHRFFSDRAVAGELGQVGECAEHPDLVAQRKLTGRDQLCARVLVVGEGSRDVPGCEVEPEQQAAQVVEAARAAGGGRRLRRRGQVEELERGDILDDS